MKPLDPALTPAEFSREYNERFPNNQQVFREISRDVIYRTAGDRITIIRERDNVNLQEFHRELAENAPHLDRVSSNFAKDLTEVFDKVLTFRDMWHIMSMMSSVFIDHKLDQVGQIDEAQEAFASTPIEVGNLVRVKSTAGFSRGAVGVVMSIDGTQVWVLRRGAGSPCWFHMDELFKLGESDNAVHTNQTRSDSSTQGA